MTGVMRVEGSPGHRRVVWTMTLDEAEEIGHAIIDAFGEQDAAAKDGWELVRLSTGMKVLREVAP